MESMLAILAGVLTASAIWLFLTADLVRYLLGLGLLSNAVNLALFAVGGLSYAAPPLLEPGAVSPPAGSANALPQALILTAIVISFGLLAYALALVARAYRVLGTVDADAFDADGNPVEKSG